MGDMLFINVRAAVEIVIAAVAVSTPGTHAGHDGATFLISSNVTTPMAAMVAAMASTRRVEVVVSCNVLSHSLSSSSSFPSVFAANACS